MAEATDGLTYRMAMDMTMRFGADGESLEMGGPVMTGEVDGGVSAMTLDMGELLGERTRRRRPTRPCPRASSTATSPWR